MYKKVSRTFLDVFRLMMTILILRSISSLALQRTEGTYGYCAVRLNPVELSAQVLCKSVSPVSFWDSFQRTRRPIEFCRTSLIHLLTCWNVRHYPSIIDQCGRRHHHR